MKLSIGISFLIIPSIGYCQSDLVVGSNYQFNIQRKNGHADAFLLHNAQYHSDMDLFSWNTTHSNFGSRGIRFSYSFESGIHFYADNLPTTSGNTFTPTTRFFIGNNGKIGVNTTNPQTLLNIFQGAGNSTTGTPAFRIGGTGNYASLEFGIKGAYDGMISTFGNDLHIYAGNWRSAGATATENHNIHFYTSRTGSSDWNTPKMFLRYDGNLGIGTTTPNEKLTVNGTMYSKEVRVDLSVPAPDYVFASDYPLLSLSEIRRYIKVNKHLPEVPSAVEMAENGIELGVMNMLLLKKIEELTLHLITLQEENIKQDAMIQELQRKNK